MKKALDIKSILLAMALMAGSFYAYAQLASAMNNTYYHDLSNGQYTSLYLTYNESNNTYTAQYTTYSEAGLPVGSQQTYNNLSEYSTEQILDTVFNPDSGWYEEA